MKGLCHVCQISNVEVSITKGKIHCAHCKNRQEPHLVKDVPDYKPFLKFEDLPQGTEQERKDHIEQVMADLKEQWFARDMRNERISEPLIDRIHDT